VELNLRFTPCNEIQLKNYYRISRMSLTETRKSSKLIDRIKRIVEDSGTRDHKLQQICELLAEEIENFDWVGFYLVDPESDRELVLGPYVGEPTEHTRIAFGEGICGQAADSLETFVVQDVSQESNYLACSVEVEAEIVVPIMKGDAFVGELDIDSHEKNSITEEQRSLCEEVCRITARLF